MYNSCFLYSRFCVDLLAIVTAFPGLLTNYYDEREIKFKLFDLILYLYFVWFFFCTNPDHKAPKITLVLDIVEKGREGNRAIINYNNPEGWILYKHSLISMQGK